jgi:hypothetical protein
MESFSGHPKTSIELRGLAAQIEKAEPASIWSGFFNVNHGNPQPGAVNANELSRACACLDKPLNTIETW